METTRPITRTAVCTSPPAACCTLRKVWSFAGRPEASSPVLPVSGRSSGPVCSCDPNLHLKTIRKKNSRILQLGFAYRFQNQAGGRPWVNPKPNKFTTPFLRSFCTPAFHPMAEIRAIASREQCLTQSTGGSPSVRRRPLEQPTGFRAVLFSFRHSVSVLKVFANQAEYSFHPPPLCCRNPVDAWQGPSGP